MVKFIINILGFLCRAIIILALFTKSVDQVSLTPEFSALADHFRQVYYDLSKNERVLKIFIVLTDIPDPIAGQCSFTTWGVGYLIMLDVEYYNKIKLDYYKMRQIFLHEMHHCIGGFFKHIDGHFYLKGNYCPRSIMNSEVMDKYEIDNCYIENLKEYESALIKNKGIGE